MDKHMKLIIWCSVLWAVGFVITGIWVLTRDYDKVTGPPWVPRTCRTQNWGVCFEPVFFVLPIFFWPIFLLVIGVYFAADKSAHLSTCFGKEVRTSRRIRRVDSINNNDI